MSSRKHFSNLDRDKGVIRATGTLMSGKEVFGGLDLRAVVKIAATYIICLENGQKGCDAVERIKEDTGLPLGAVREVVESRLLPKFLLQKIALKRKILSSNEKKTVIPYLMLLAEGHNDDSAIREVARKLNKHPNILQDQLKQTITKILSSLKFDSLSFETYFP